MQELYTINHVALMSGLSSRTIRNYMKMGFIEGEMINGVWWGKGVLTSDNGWRYEGEFVNGKQHGKGKLTFFVDMECNPTVRLLRPDIPH